VTTETEPLYAANTPLSFFRGDDILQEFTFRNPDGVLIDLSGCTIVAKANQVSGPVSNRLLTLAEVGSVSEATFTIGTSNLAGGTFSISIPRATSANMLGLYNYDVRITDTDDLKLTRIYGTLNIKRNVAP
jgi:hypothetical protein